jgi:GT2 family glycosyltransferase
MQELDYDVVIVAHNHAETLSACLAAVRSLAPPPAAVVVVDNASEDASVPVIDQHRDGLPLTLVRESTNTGFSAGVNRALAACRADWVLSLNPDCAPAPGYAARLYDRLSSLRDAERIGSATGRIVRASGSELTPTPVIDAAGMIVTPSGRHLDRGAGEAEGDRYDEPAWVFGGTGAALLLRRAALADVAYSDGQVLAESFFAFREDAELAWRLQWRGWRCLYVPEARATHRRGLRPERGRAQPAAVNRWSVRNRFLLRAHCADLAWHLRCFPWWLARDLLVIAACLTVERSSLPGFASLWRLRHDARQRRRWVLGRATVPSPEVRRWFRPGAYVEPLDD